MPLSRSSSAAGIVLSELMLDLPSVMTMAVLGSPDLSPLMALNMFLRVSSRPPAVFVRRLSWVKAMAVSTSSLDEYVLRWKRTLGESLYVTSPTLVRSPSKLSPWTMRRTSSSSMLNVSSTDPDVSRTNTTSRLRVHSANRESAWCEILTHECGRTKVFNRKFNQGPWSLVLGCKKLWLVSPWLKRRIKTTQTCTVLEQQPCTWAGPTLVHGCENIGWNWTKFTESCLLLRKQKKSLPWCGQQFCVCRNKKGILFLAQQKRLLHSVTSSIFVTCKHLCSKQMSNLFLKFCLFLKFPSNLIVKKRFAETLWIFDLSIRAICLETEGVFVLWDSTKRANYPWEWFNIQYVRISFHF